MIPFVIFCSYHTVLIRLWWWLWWWWWGGWWWWCALCYKNISIYYKSIALPATIKKNASKYADLNETWKWLSYFHMSKVRYSPYCFASRIRARFRSWLALNVKNTFWYIFSHGKEIEVGVKRRVQFRWWSELDPLVGSRGTAKSLKECEVILVLSYMVKYALLHIYFVLLLDPRLDE